MGLRAFWGPSGGRKIEDFRKKKYGFFHLHSGGRNRPPGGPNPAKKVFFWPPTGCLGGPLGGLSAFWGPSGGRKSKIFEKIWFFPSSFRRSKPTSWRSKSSEKGGFLATNGPKKRDTMFSHPPAAKPPRPPTSAVGAFGGQVHL